MNWLKLRRYAGVARSAASVAKSLTELWKYTRKQQVFTLDVYARLVKIAEKRGIKVPKTKVKMYAEN